MKVDLREIYGAPTRAAAEAAIDVFADKYGAKYDKAVACLTKDREALLAFFDFPAEHWDHLRHQTLCVNQFLTLHRCGSSEPIREVLESDELDVIHDGRLILWRAPDVEA